jgi:hypothetical protein
MTRANLVFVEKSTEITTKKAKDINQNNRGNLLNCSGNL